MSSAGSPERDGDAMIYVGTDSRGIEIEVVAVPDDRDPAGLAVIHAMPTAFRGRGRGRGRGVSEGSADE